MAQALRGRSSGTRCRVRYRAALQNEYRFESFVAGIRASRNRRIRQAFGKTCRRDRVTQRVSAVPVDDER